MSDQCGHIWAIQDDLGRPFCAECGAPWPHKEQPTSKSDVASEIAWLIEMTESERAGRPPIYWGHVEEGEGWTADVNEAFRFDTEAVADMRASDVGIPDYVIIEHAWVRALTSHESTK